MTHALTMSDSSECLLRIVESAPQVRRRYQFFLWSQGDLQRWLPHKLLVCAAYDRQQRDLVFDVFNSVPLPEGLVGVLRDGGSALLARAILTWRQHRQQPCHLVLPEVSQDEAMQQLRSAGYRQWLLHGLSRPARPEEIESFFIFSAPHLTFDEASLQAADMLLPCLHTTYQRVYAMERQMAGGAALTAPSPAPAARTPAITEREREILRWVRDGLSNQQISEKLGISALTVKNHVQKILRKLGAANRAQAVAKAMAMNALHQPVGPGGLPDDR